MKVKTNPLDQLTQERLELGAKVVTSIGVALISYGMCEATVHIGKDAVAKAESEIPPAPSDGKSHKVSLVKKVSKIAKDLWEYAKNPAKIVDDLSKQVDDKAKQITAAVGDAAKATLQVLYDKLFRQYINALSYLDSILDAIKSLKYGIALAAAGLSFWLLSHPDVVKVALQEIGHVARQIVDEISEAGTALASLIDQLMPSLLQIIGLM